MIRYPLEFNQILNRSKYNTFGMVRKYSDGSPKFHKGWDLQQPKWTPVYPVSTGVITDVQMGDVGKYGRSITLKFKHDGKTYWAFYAHLEMVMFPAGFEVTKTNLAIGFVGDSGNAKGIDADKVHLHFEFRNRSFGGNGTEDRIDPAKLLGAPPYDGIFYIDDE